MNTINGIERIENSFKQTKAYIAYLTAGDGGIQRTLESALALIDGGVNILEIGVPFSDPIADGPVIQRAAERALAAGICLEDILWLTREIRKKSEIPLILFSYLNPILAEFNTGFFSDAAAAGIDGILTVDCPVEESAEFNQKCLDYNIAPIYVIATSTSVSRMIKINQQAKGFLYYACRKGTTGMRSSLPEDFAEKIKLIKLNTNLPVITGFGISNYITAKEVLQHCDGVVVGSLFVKAIEDGISPNDLKNLAININPLKDKIN